MNLIAKIFWSIISFHCDLMVILGGLISLANLAGSFLIFSNLARPAWEMAILVGVSLFIFTWFSVWVVRRRPSRDSASKLSDEHMEEMEGWLADELDSLKEIEEELSEARREGKEEEVKELEEARKDSLSQIERYELEVKVEKLRRLEEEASKVGSMTKAEEYSKQIEKHEATLKELVDRIEDQSHTLVDVLIASFVLGGVGIVFGWCFLVIPMFMLVMPAFLWEAWAGGSEWMRSPGAMIAVIFSCLVQACVGAWVVSWHFSSDGFRLSSDQEEECRKKRRQPARSDKYQRRSDRRLLRRNH